jgi:hypothetical protein
MLWDGRRAVASGTGQQHYSVTLEDACSYVRLLLGKCPSLQLPLEAVTDAAHQQAVREGLQRQLAAAAAADQRAGTSAPAAVAAGAAAHAAGVGLAAVAATHSASPLGASASIGACEACGANGSRVAVQPLPAPGIQGATASDWGGGTGGVCIVEVAASPASRAEGVSDKAECAELAHTQTTAAHDALVAAYVDAVVADQRMKLSVFVVRPAVLAPMHNWVLEFSACTFLVLPAMLFIHDGGRWHPLLQPLYPTFAGVFVCLLLFVMLLGTGGAGAVLNPAVDMAGRAVHLLTPIPGKGPSELHAIPLYLSAHIAAALVGGLLFRCVDSAASR